jgi:ribosomal protein L12E/L44/L45/RPP1/RPP2
MRYKQLIAIIQLLEACDKEPNAENIQKVASCMDIDITIAEVETLAAIVNAMGGYKNG